MGSRRQREGMKLARSLRETGDANPLSGLVFEISRFLDFQVRDAGRKQLGFADRQLGVGPTSADDLIEDEDAERTDEEEIEEGILNETSNPVENHENVENDVELVRVPEGVEDVSTSVRRREDVDDGGD